MGQPKKKKKKEAAYQVLRIGIGLFLRVAGCEVKGKSKG